MLLLIYIYIYYSCSSILSQMLGRHPVEAAGRVRPPSNEVIRPRPSDDGVREMIGRGEIGGG